MFVQERVRCDKKKRLKNRFSDSRDHRERTGNIRKRPITYLSMPKFPLNFRRSDGDHGLCRTKQTDVQVLEHLFYFIFFFN